MTKFNDGKHIETVVNRINCSRHAAPQGTACWDVIPDTDQNRVAPAVCGNRIRAAGYNGKISVTSVQAKKSVHKKKEVNA